MATQKGDDSGNEDRGGPDDDAGHEPPHRVRLVWHHRSEPWSSIESLSCCSVPGFGVWFPWTFDKKWFVSPFVFVFFSESPFPVTEWTIDSTCLTES